MPVGRSAKLPFALCFESSDLGLGFLVGSAALSSLAKIYGSGSGGNGGSVGMRVGMMERLRKI